VVDSTLGILLSRNVVLTALKVALGVGTVLAAINHGDKVLQDELHTGDMFKIALTYLVPYMVSSYSSLKMAQKLSAQ
jgi:hypothetical protein